VAKCISRLQRGKAPGLDGIMAEHVLYARPVISTVLARLFTAMLKHGYDPQAFGLGVVIPILKDDSLDCTKPDNYRGITLSPIISKLFEMCLLDLFGDYLCTNDLQMGFKAKDGCQNAISVLSASVDCVKGHCSLKVCRSDT